MAAPTNTTTSYSDGTPAAFGNREDLENKIYRVAPEETPLMNNIDRGPADAVTHEWQTEQLPTPSATNQALEGDVMNLQAPNLTARIGNLCQINRKDYGVSATQEAVRKAGRASELNRQRILFGIAARRDAEARFIGNYPTQAESGANPRQSGGALAAIVSNTSLGTGGSNGGIAGSTWTAATNGTQRTLTEPLVKAALSSMFSNGGRSTMAFMGPVQKQEWSGFSGIASIRSEIVGKKMATIIGAADVYVSDFGNLALVPHPYGLTRDVLGIDPDFWAVATLRGWKTKPFAQTSDGKNEMIVAEHTLVARNERSSFAIRDLQ